MQLKKEILEAINGKPIYVVTDHRTGRIYMDEDYKAEIFMSRTKAEAYLKTVNNPNMQVECRVLNDWNDLYRDLLRLGYCKFILYKHGSEYEMEIMCTLDKALQFNPKLNRMFIRAVQNDDYSAFQEIKEEEFLTPIKSLNNKILRAIVTIENKRYYLIFTDYVEYQKWKQDNNWDDYYDSLKSAAIDFKKKESLGNKKKTKKPSVNIIINIKSDNLGIPNDVLQEILKGEGYASTE